MNIELRQLRYFVAVAEEMHFGRAARRLHMTQPPLSQAIQALETRLGAEVFHRTRRSVTLSAAGLALLPEARRLLSQADALPSIAQRAAAGESGSLSIAFVSMADYSVMPQALREFRGAYPSVQIQLHEATTDLQLEMLSTGEIDLGMLVMPLPDKLKAEFDSLPVLSEPLMLALPEGLVRKRGPVSLTQLADQPLIVFPRRLAPAFHDKILGRFHEAGLTPRIGQEAIQMQTIIALVSAGMGIALVPQSVSNLQRPGVEYRTLKEAGAPIDMGLAWRRDNNSPVLAAFIELMRKTS
jgi:DNA-binding transcriptional LysR family regulator